MEKTFSHFAGLKVRIAASVAVSVLAGTYVYAASAPALYTVQQATDGQAAFVQHCASCHGEYLRGGAGPALIGQNFSAASSNNTIGSIFTLLSTQMPLGNGGGLTHTQYEVIMSYILSKNGYPAGQTKLDYTVRCYQRFLWFRKSNS